jgi:hypothetical protein
MLTKYYSHRFQALVDNTVLTSFSFMSVENYEYFVVVQINGEKEKYVF